MFVKLKDGNLLFDKMIDITKAALPVGDAKGVSIVSTEDEDWDGDIIHHLPNDKGQGWILNTFNAHGRVLWMHDTSIPAIGRGAARVEEIKVPRLLMEYVWDLADPFAAEIAGKYERRFLDQWSVGFISTEYDVREGYSDLWWPPYDIWEAELLEVSAVNLSTNPNTGPKSKSKCILPVNKSLLRNYAHMLADEYSDDSKIADLVAENQYWREEIESRLKTLEKNVAHGHAAPGRTADDVKNLQAAEAEALGQLVSAVHRFHDAARGTQ